MHSTIPESQRSKREIYPTVENDEPRLYICWLYTLRMIHVNEIQYLRQFASNISIENAQLL